MVHECANFQQSTGENKGTITDEEADDDTDEETAINITNLHATEWTIIPAKHADSESMLHMT